VRGSVGSAPPSKVGYLAQADEPPRDATLLGLVRDANPLYEDQAVRLLGRFLFRYEQVREPVEALSGGERTRLRLLLLMLDEPTCLILDEPTNHLDIGSLEVLEAELERFAGTGVFVSHDHKPRRLRSSSPLSKTSRSTSSPVPSTITPTPTT
jgi:ATP-binding cassette, subfamily F, member 3